MKSQPHTTFVDKENKWGQLCLSYSRTSNTIVWSQNRPSRRLEVGIVIVIIPCIAYSVDIIEVKPEVACSCEKDNYRSKAIVEKLVTNCRDKTTKTTRRRRIKQVTMAIVINIIQPVIGT